MELQKTGVNIAASPTAKKTHFVLTLKDNNLNVIRISEYNFLVAALNEVSTLNKNFLAEQKHMLHVKDFYKRNNQLIKKLYKSKYADISTLPKRKMREQYFNLYTKFITLTQVLS